MEDGRDNPRALCVHCALPVPANRRKRGGEAASYCCLGCHLVHQMVRAGEDHDEGGRANPLLLRLGVGIFLGVTFLLGKIESYYLSPRLTAQHVKLPGIVLVVSLLLFETLFGFYGLFLSFPALYVASRIANEWKLADAGEPVVVAAVAVAAPASASVPPAPASIPPPTSRPPPSPS